MMSPIILFVCLRTISFCYIRMKQKVIEVLKQALGYSIMNRNFNSGLGQLEIPNTTTTQRIALGFS